MTDFLSAIPGLLIITLGYAALCAISPFGTCRKCNGWGHEIRKAAFTGRLVPGRVCRRCDGHGRRIRIGRWLYNRISAIHRNGTR